MESWKRIASRRTGLGLTKSELIKLNNAKLVSSRIIENLAMEEPKANRVFTCKDEEGKIQSIATVENLNNDLCLKDLLTHPYNLSSKVRSATSFEVRGTGRALIEHLFCKCIEEHKESITVKALKGTRGFYVKHKFVSASSDKNDPTMKISVDQIQGVLNSKQENSESDNRKRKRDS